MEDKKNVEEFDKLKTSEKTIETDEINSSFEHSDQEEFRPLPFLKEAFLSKDKLQDYYIKKRKYQYDNNLHLKGRKFRETIHPALIKAMSIERKLRGLTLTVLDSDKVPIIYVVNVIDDDKNNLEKDEVLEKQGGEINLEISSETISTGRKLDDVIIFSDNGILSDVVGSDGKVTITKEEQIIDVMKKGEDLIICPNDANLSNDFSISSLFPNIIDMAIDIGCDIVPVTLDLSEDEHFLRMGTNVQVNHLKKVYTKEDRERVIEEKNHELSIEMNDLVNDHLRFKNTSKSEKRFMETKSNSQSDPSREINQEEKQAEKITSQSYKIKEDSSFQEEQDAVVIRQDGILTKEKLAELLMAFDCEMNARNSKNNKDEKKRTVIYDITHIGKDDIQLVSEAINEPQYVFLGDPETMYRTFDGFIMYLSGEVLCDTDDKGDRIVAQNIAVDASKRGMTMVYFSEGVWNMSANLLVLPLFPGVVKNAIESDSDIIPIGIEQYENHFYVKFGSRINTKHWKRNFDNEDEKKAYVDEKVQDLRDAKATLKLDIIESQPVEKRSAYGSFEEEYEKFKQKRYNEWVDPKTKKPYYNDEIVKRRTYKVKGVNTAAEVFHHLSELEVKKENAFLFKRGLLGTPPEIERIISEKVKKLK